MGPRGVSKVTDISPGVPCGAVQAMLISGIGLGSSVPSHSRSRSRSPAISSAEIVTPDSAPRAEGCWVAGESQWMKNGS